MINKIDFTAKNLTSNAGLFQLLENTKNNGIFNLIENDLVFDNDSINKTKMKHVKTMLRGHFIGIEEINLGEWQGLTWSEVKEVYEEDFNDWFFHRRYSKSTNGESYQDLIERVLSALICIIEAGT